jgi:tryptophan 7-halogenase
VKVTAADALRGKLEGGQIVVEFGQSQSPAANEQGRTILLSEQIVMPPSTAKRLISALGDCLRKHASTVHAAEAGPLTHPQAAEVMRRGRIPVNAPAEEAGDKAALLLRLVSSLGVPYQYERSFRMSEGALLANRFLLTFNTRDIQGRPVERVLDICRRLEIPRSLEASAEQSFGMANCLHFGFESGPASIVFKLYQERAIAPGEAERARVRSEPVLQHIAFKWDILKNADVVTRYLCHPALSAEGIEERLSQVYRGGQSEFSFEIAKAVLHLAASRTPAERLQYLEVQEDENERRSFDLNLYNAGMQVKDLQQLLYRARAHYGIRPGQFQALYDQIKTKALGHLAGGIHRNGRDFFNVYYGVTGFPKFSTPFA